MIQLPVTRVLSLPTPCRTPISVGVIDYTSSNGYTPFGFLNSPSFTNQVNGFDPNASLNNTFILITGDTFLNAGNNAFVVPHDDGVVLTVNGATPSLVLNQPGPTSPVDTPFNVVVPAAGTYSFQLQYAECCGPPARLAFTVNSNPIGTPEPATMAMLGAGLLAVGFFRRRKQV